MLSSQLRHLACLSLLAVFATGCGRFVFKPSQQTVKLSAEQQQSALAATQRFQHQASKLDKDNQELESLLAQSRQQIQLLRDEVQATRSQLQNSTSQLAEARSSNQSLQQRTQALAASVQRQTTASIRPNNSLLRELAIANLPGVHVRADGDVIRVEISSDQLFQPGSAYLKTGAKELVRSVASELLSAYPRQKIGVEGHTERSSRTNTQYASPFHLSVAQAMVVYDSMIRDARAPANHLFVIGQGAEHPVVSNATTAGQARNRRIELVVYPDTVTR